MADVDLGNTGPFGPPQGDINIDTTQEPETISVDNPQAITKRLSPDATNYRSDNAHFGLTNQTFFTKDDWTKAIQNGQEDQLREAAANKVNVNRSQMAKQILSEERYNILDRPGGEQTLRDMIKAQDPSSVIEEHYAKTYMDFLNWPTNPKQNSMDSWAYRTQKTMHDEWEWVKNAGSTVTAKDNYMLTVKQNDDANWKDTAKAATYDIFTAGIYGETQMRQNTAGTPWYAGTGLGSNLQAQSDRLSQISDFDTWRQEFDRVYNQLPPAYRQPWVDSMLYKGSSSIVADNVITAMNASIFGKLGFNVARNLATPELRAMAAARSFAAPRIIERVNAQSQLQNIINAVTDMAKTRPEVIPPNVAAPAQAGNLPESAVNKVAIEAINELYPNNNPLGAFINRLMALNDADGTLAASDPGNLGREAANRLKDMYNTYKDDFVQTVFNAYRQQVDRTPTADMIDRLHAIQKGLANWYTGADNMVGNVSRGLWMPGVNSRLYNIAVVSNDAELFKTIEEAMANARRNGWAIKGDYAVGPDERASIIRKEGMIKHYRTEAALLARTAENPDEETLARWAKYKFDPKAGIAKANAAADKLQKELDKIPRHQTGVTIESQRLPAPTATPIAEPLGAPRTPRTGTPTEPTPTPTPTTETPTSKVVPFKAKYSSTYDRLVAELGREPTLGELGAALERPEDLKGAGTAKSAEDKANAARLSKGPLDMGEDEHLLQYHIRKKMEREYFEGRSDVPPPKEPPKTRAQQLMDNEGVAPIESIIKQQGNGYYILHTVALPEDANFVRSGLLTSKYGELSKEEFLRQRKLGLVSTGIPNTWGANFIGAVTNLLGISAPSEVMSISETMNRNIAVHGPNVLLGMIKRGLKPLSPGELNPTYWNDFNRLIRYGMNTFNEETRTPGIWFNTMSDVDHWYQNNIGRQITEPEMRAYFAYKAMVLNDLNFRNLAVMTRKLSMGFREHAVQYLDEYGSKVTSPYFEGVRLDHIPGNGRALLVSAEAPAKSKFDSIEDLIRYNPQVGDDIMSGKAKLVQIADPRSKPLRDIDKRGIDYVISYDNEERPLGVDHVNRLGGGHFVPRWDYYMKQADVETTDMGNGRKLHVYNGDKTLLSFQTAAQGKEAATALDRVRVLLSKYMKDFGSDWVTSEEIQRWENEGGALGRSIRGADILEEAAIEAQRTGIPFGKLLDMWVGPAAPFNVHEPLVIVRKGSKIINTGTDGAELLARYRQNINGVNKELIDATRDGSLMGQIMTEFTQERDAEGLFTMARKGTEGSPWFAYEHADTVDPITAFERGASNIIHSMYMWDMKAYSMRHWLEQARDYLEDAASIQNNPLKHFYKPVYKDGITFSEFQTLEGNRRAALDFVGLQSKYDTSLTQIGQAVFDWLYGKGKFVVRSLADLPKITKFTDAMKNFAFYTYMSGPKAFFTQAATLSYVNAVAGPVNAVKATAAMMMYGFYRVNPNFLPQMDAMMSRYYGWKLGSFERSVKMLDGSGFATIGQEHAFRQGSTTLGLQSMPTGDITPWNIGVKATMRLGKAALDMSTVPFELGASTTRISGFFTAFLEHEAIAPGGIIDRQLQSSILTRASLLDMNMSRAHNMRLQNNSLLSIPFQFRSFDIRTAQAMWGKNLSPEDKQRLLAISTALYGLRGGGLALYGIPTASYVLSSEYDRGDKSYIPGESALKDIIMNGFISWLFASYTGFTNKDGHKTWVDLSNWGTRGIDDVNKIFNSDNTIASILTGAAGNAFGQVLDASWGLRHAAWDLATGGSYKATSDDWLKLLDVLNITKDFHQGWQALEIGRNITDKGTYVTNQSAVETFLKNFMGVKSIDQADTFIKQKIISNYSEEMRWMQPKIDQEIFRWARDKSNNDDVSAADHYRNAMLLLRMMPEHERRRMATSATRNLSEPLKKRIEEKLYIDFQNNSNTYIKQQQRK